MIGATTASQSLRSRKHAGCGHSPAPRAFWRRAAHVLAAQPPGH